MVTKYGNGSVRSDSIVLGVRGVLEPLNINLMNGRDDGSPVSKKKACILLPPHPTKGGGSAAVSDTKDSDVEG